MPKGAPRFSNRNVIRNKHQNYAGIFMHMKYIIEVDTAGCIVLESSDAGRIESWFIRMLILAIENHMVRRSRNTAPHYVNTTYFRLELNQPS